MASPSELSLDCKPHSYSMLLKSFGDQIDQTQKIEDFLSRLEEERLKIDAFKRELPLCMQLLTNAVEAHRQQLQAYRGNQGPRPVLEEFIPLKQSTSESSEKSSNNSDKANWMTSAQLWSQASDGTKSQSAINISPKEPDIGFSVSPKLAFDGKQRNGGAFHPFSKERNSCPSPTLRDLPDLALASADQKELEDKKCLETENGISCPRRDQNIIGKGSNGGVVVEQGKGPGGNSSDGQTTATTTAPNTSQSHRKARRCWSPDLHRRFVNALQMLGGSQATPKQIRELMKVDGLTNDEVKSHLQASHKTTQSKPTSIRSPRSPASSPRWHMGPTRVCHGRSSSYGSLSSLWNPSWLACTLTLLWPSSSTRILCCTATATSASPPVAPPRSPPPSPRLQGHATDEQLARIRHQRDWGPVGEH
ncbi:myb family transcription factor EFM-like isoform X4 [Juglans microcarpa x Juglans regia]|uniref:myb family transcription factor EFM-like isoform X4 n=1 Tax=Juglans microcarpa x Juglans regia TaxID=2249226 RepID=UPI001B7EE48B|nr:myb family transcription factor EFM-like isoform X4 [Juglans microcarpa x Juglans regia]